jgi:hypothetical protein
MRSVQRYISGYQVERRWSGERGDFSPVINNFSGDEAPGVLMRKVGWCLPRSQGSSLKCQAQRMRTVSCFGREQRSRAHHCCHDTEGCERRSPSDGYVKGVSHRGTEGCAATMMFTFVIRCNGWGFNTYLSEVFASSFSYTIRLE